MKLIDLKASNECPKLEPVARAMAHLAAIQRERYERAKTMKDQSTRAASNQSLRAE